MTRTWNDMRTQAIKMGVISDVATDQAENDDLDVPEWACKKCGGTGLRALQTTNAIVHIGCPDCHETGVADLSGCTLFMDDDE